MKRVFAKRLLPSLVAAALAAAIFMPGSAHAAQYTTFVGCDYLSSSPTPSHICQLGDSPGAFFEADEETEYEVCLEPPNLELLCSNAEFAEGETLYVNSFSTEFLGKHSIYWYLAGTETEIGSWEFEMQEPPPPPPPPPLVLQFPTFTGPAVSAECLKAQQRVRKLKGRLRLANCSCQRVKIRARLKKAKAALRRAC
jgi:hypothetical protein